ncbi:MAG: DNA polymerase II large subunit [Candidatus Hadarchaeota archaeon]
MKDYFDRLREGLERAYDRAEDARSKGLDPRKEPEVPLADDLAARVEELAGPEGVAKSIRDLESEMDSREDLAFEIAAKIVDGEFGFMSDSDAAEQAVRTCLAIITEGVAAAAPIEGITKVDVKENFDGSNYLAIYFAGPIRSAGGTAAALAVLTGDFVREKLDLSSYKPSDSEVERMIEEVNIYDTSVGLQYSPKEDEVRSAYENIPVEVTGEPTESETVTGYGDLERIETDRVRGGAVLAIAEGVLQKAPKIMKHLGNLELSGWEWISDLGKTSGDEEEKRDYPKGDKYLGDIIAGRGVFGYPGEKGGFRLRYGRSRNTGLAAAGIHPATMRILNDHISTGTQLKTERPGKATVASPVDTLEGPIVKIGNGSVLRVDSAVQAEQIKDDVEEILSLGDILFGYGEFLENNHPLMPSGYCEEWWAQEVEMALEGNSEFELESYIYPPFDTPSPEMAVRISEELEVPLHPAYTYDYTELDWGELKELGEWLISGKPSFEDGLLKKIRLDVNSEGKEILEKLLIPHQFVEGEGVVIGKESLPFCKSLGILHNGNMDLQEFSEKLGEFRDMESFAIVERLASFPLRMKAPTWIGSRMGRPEKTKPREMSPPVHCLFPIGRAGGSTRNITKAAKKGSVEVEVAYCECPDCGEKTVLRRCSECGSRTKLVRRCPQCERPMEEEECVSCGSNTIYYEEREVELESLLRDSKDRLGARLPDTLKGVEGMLSSYKLPEPLEKGILRAKNGLSVFKDGTVRFDATDVPLTHFRPGEVGVSVERLRELGYSEDYRGNPLESENQLLELKVQDVLLPGSAADYFLRASQFVDDLLTQFYDLPSFYNAETREDLVGHLVIGLAPHTSAGITGRIIGFSEANVGYAHPYFHAAKRRNADGDEDALLLLLDALLNFSEYYLPETRGGRMDAPLVLTPTLDPTEIDDEAHNVDVERRYPLDFYEYTLEYKDPGEVSSMVQVVEDRLGGERQYEEIDFNEAHDTSTISGGPKECKYKSLGPMEEKTDSQMELATKIRGVDESDVAERLIENHFIPDLKGNLRAFSRQRFRCPNCNAKFRRVPLSGKCENCGGDLILTVTYGGVEKYMQVALRVAKDYGVTSYTTQRLDLLEEEIESLFESDVKEQMSLGDFVA